MHERTKNIVGKRGWLFKNKLQDQENIGGQAMTEVGKRADIRQVLIDCANVLEVYVNGSNPNSPYKDGKHSCYVLGAKEALGKAKQAIAQETTRELSLDKIEKVVNDYCQYIVDEGKVMFIYGKVATAIKQAHQAGELWEER